MPDRHPAAEYVRLFPSEDIPRIVQNIQECCCSLIRIQPGEWENSLSERLFKKLLRFPEYHTGPIEPHMESITIDCEKDEPEITGRTDLKFSCGRGVQTYFAVEAKRLFITYPSGKTATLISDYINDGMMRFVKGQYASKMNAGAMLGYVCDKKVPDAKMALSAAVNKEKVLLKMMEEGEWQLSDLCVNPPIDETRHLLAQGEFTIYHILTPV